MSSITLNPLAIAAGAVAPGLAVAQPADEPVSFFVVGDTHYLADRDDVRYDIQAAA